MDNHRNNPAEFEDFINHHRLVTPEKARFYVYWAERFLKYFQNSPSKPLAQIISLKAHLQRIKKIHDQDLAKGYRGTKLPDALEKKYPNANKEWIWQWVFPSKSLVVHPLSEMVLRHHVQPSIL